jgi:hypothetical protein
LKFYDRIDAKYHGAIKAGLICALVLIILTISLQIIFAWALSHQSLMDWVTRQYNATQNMTVPASSGVADLPAEGWIVAIALLLFGILSVLVLFISGVLSTIFSRPYAAKARDAAVLGAIAGVIAHITGSLVTILVSLAQKLWPSTQNESMPEILSWLGGQILFNITWMLLLALVLSVFGALVTWLFLIREGKKAGETST